MLVLYSLKVYSVDTLSRAASIPMSEDKGFTRLLIRAAGPRRCMARLVESGALQPEIWELIEW